VSATEKDSKLWNYSSLSNVYSQTPNRLLGNRLQHILDWAEKRDVLIETDNKYPSFRIKGKYGKKIISFWAPDGSKEKPGSLYCYFHPNCHGGNTEEIKRFAEKLNKISIFNYDTNKIESGRNSEGVLQELDEDEFDRFMETLDEACFGNDKKLFINRVYSMLIKKIKIIFYGLFNSISEFLSAKKK